jgi:hypothetical protein
MSELLAREVESVLRIEKRIREDLAWRPDAGSRKPKWKIEGTVIVPDTSETLKIHGNRSARNWGFSLVMRGVPIRRFNVQNAPHRNPDGTIIREPHKHKWDENQGDREAYIPDDIDVTDVNQAFLDFLKECRIVHDGTYRTFTFL